MKLWPLFKLKAFSDDHFKVAKKEYFSFHGVENIVGKEENAVCQHFHLSPQCFQNCFCLWVVESLQCAVKSYILSLQCMVGSVLDLNFCALAWIDWGHTVFALSVCPQKTLSLTLAITFEW